MAKEENKNTSRKPRADRKRHVYPVVSVELYDCLARISYVTTTPIKDVGETLCLEGLKSKSVMDELSPYFRRDYHQVNEYGEVTFIPGNPDRITVKVDRGDGERKRVSIRFSQPCHDLIGTLAYSLDLTINSATALLLQASFDHEIGLNYIVQFIKHEILDPRKRKQIEEIHKFINLNNHPDDQIPFSELLRHLSQQAYEQNTTVSKFLHQWIDSYYEEED